MTRSGTTGTTERLGRLTGRHVLAILVGFFLIVFAANFVLVWLALGSWPGLETKSAYEAGRVYQGEIEASRQQSERQWQVAAKVERSGDGVTIRVDARDGAGAPVTGIGFTARLARPTTTAEDGIVTLSETSPGLYVGTAPKIEPGSWTVTLEADDGTARLYRSRNRITVK